MAIALVSIIIVGASNMIIFAMRAHEMSVDEFDVQANLRLLSHKINDVSRDSSGAFILHRENANNLTSGWNYIMLSADKTKMLEYKWDAGTSTHIVKELYSGAPGVTLNLTFNKSNAPDEDKLVMFDLKMLINGQERKIDSEVESINALQVVDRAYGKVANTIAYRNDKRISEITSAQAAVAMVLDTSGSMARDLNGNEGVATADQRIYKLKQETLRLIDELAKNPNVYISLNPFDTNANDSKPMLEAQKNNKVNDAFSDTELSKLLVAGGGTNTGDGIRRAYHRILEFGKKDSNKNKTTKNFMIILVDGTTTYASCKAAYYSYFDQASNFNSTINHNGLAYKYIGNYKYGSDYYYRYMHYNPSSIQFVVADDNTSAYTFDDRSNQFYDKGRIAGNGSVIDPIGTAYVNHIGALVRDHEKDKDGEIKVYVIGFSNVSNDLLSLKDIALATTGTTQYYTAGSSEALQTIFDAIGKDISDALWHIGGPN